MRTPSVPLRAPASGSASPAGFSLLDLLIGISVLAVALLSQVGSTLSSHHMMDTQSTRTAGLDGARQVLERLRSEEDWRGLYARLLSREELAASGSPPLRFRDGEGAWLPQAYFPDFVAPPSLQDLGILIRVPTPKPPASNPSGAPVLREDVVDPEFGLPTDLNTDTIVDGEARNGDYQMLPIVLRLRWRGAQGGTEELRVATWLRGGR